MGKTTNKVRVKRLLQKLDRPKGPGGFKRPYFIEITGSPDSGKTSIIKKVIYPFFKNLGFRVRGPQEGAEEIVHIPRTSHLYNVRTCLYAWRFLIDESVNPNYDLVIFDRCLFDGVGWMKRWVRRGDISEEQAKTLINFFLFPTWLEYLDAIFIVTADPSATKQRENEFLDSQLSGETSSPESVRELKQIFTEVYREYGSNNDKFHLVDTTNMKKKEMGAFFLEKVISALEKRF